MAHMKMYWLIFALSVMAGTRRNHPPHDKFLIWQFRQECFHVAEPGRDKMQRAGEPLKSTSLVEAEERRDGNDAGRIGE